MSEPCPALIVSLVDFSWNPAFVFEPECWGCAKDGGCEESTFLFVCIDIWANRCG